MNNGELHSLLENYWSWLRDETELRPVEGSEYVEITAPLLDHHNDYLQIYARASGHGWELTDDGYTLRDLRASGCDFTTDKRSQLLNVTLQRLGVRREGEALVVHAGADDFAEQKHALVQAMLAVGDLFHTSSATVIGLFFEEVAKWLDEYEVPHLDNVQFPGTSGYSHHFDFAIPSYRGAPERIMEAISRPDRAHVERFIMAWSDTRETRPSDTRAVAVLNDAEKSVPSGSLEALANYEITPVLWTERERYAVEELAA